MIPPCYVITLNGTLGTQGDALKSVGLNPSIFHGINAKKDEHLKYVDYINPDSLRSRPKSILGCGLSHVLLAQKIFYTGASIALILEDDAYPIDGFDIEQEIEKVINEVPEDWEIIRLHCDTHCVDGQNEIGDNSSAAAYLINTKGMEIMMNTKVKDHIDWHQNEIINVYKSKVNLFYTVEDKVSTNRIQRKTIMSNIMENLQPITTGEKTWDDKLSYKSYRMPWNGIEINAGEKIIIFILIVILIVLIDIYLIV